MDALVRRQEVRLGVLVVGEIGLQICASANDVVPHIDGVVFAKRVTAAVTPYYVVHTAKLSSPLFGRAAVLCWIDSVTLLEGVQER
jgi:hypothetical protein